MSFIYGRGRRVIHKSLGTPGTVETLSSTREGLNCYSIRWDNGTRERGVLEELLMSGDKLPPVDKRRGRADRQRLEELRAEDWTLSIERVGKYKYLNRYR